MDEVFLGDLLPRKLDVLLHKTDNEYSPKHSLEEQTEEKGEEGGRKRKSAGGKVKSGMS